MNSEKERIQKMFEKSYKKSLKILQNIYQYEVNYHLSSKNDEKQKYSNSAHEYKDDLLKELDSFDGIMSINMRRNTRKRSRNNTVEY